ncbi:MAG: non-homologous end-joining DNA ligase [Nocardioides sp.]|uniref:non-homologous end-joining DNA ligase n=1 Tax=Nocardioides sp. TaxID=35761 RepID=UPI003F11F172
MLPMLATKGRHVPGSGLDAGQWAHEVKWDGVRILGESGADGAWRLTTRNGNDVTQTWPDVLSLAPSRDLVVDGEVIALDEAGRPNFGVVAQRLHVRSRATAARMAAQVPATYMVFDLLRLDGRDLTGRPWEERREALESLDLPSHGWQVPPTYDDGEMLLQATAAQGLEGIVSKRVSSRYEPGARSANWLKFAHRTTTSVVVGGWRPQEGTDHRLAALLVGEPTPDGLVYRGRVGSGIGGAASRMLSEVLAGRTLSSSPFADEVPRMDAQGTTWVEPFLVVEVASLGRSRGDKLRQPSYQGVRTDLEPTDLLLRDDA